MMSSSHTWEDTESRGEARGDDYKDLNTVICTGIVSTTLTLPKYLSSSSTYLWMISRVISSLSWSSTAQQKYRLAYLIHKKGGKRAKRDEQGDDLDKYWCFSHAEITFPY